MLVCKLLDSKHHNACGQFVRVSHIHVNEIKMSSSFSVFTYRKGLKRAVKLIKINHLVVLQKGQAEKKSTLFGDW